MNLRNDGVFEVRRFGDFQKDKITASGTYKIKDEKLKFSSYKELKYWGIKDIYIAFSAKELDDSYLGEDMGPLIIQDEPVESGGYYYFYLVKNDR